MSLQAVLYHAPKASYKAPLLSEDDSDICSIVELSNNMLHGFKQASLGLGLLTGWLLQMSTLGVNYLVFTAWGGNLLTTRNFNESLVASLILSLVTASTSCAVMSLLRNLVVNTPVGASNREVLILQIECRFTVGALTGFLYAWILSDVLLGRMSGSSLLITAVTLLIAIAFCRIMMRFFIKAPSTIPNDEIV